VTQTLPTLPTLSDAVTEYRKRGRRLWGGRRLWDGERLDPADECMLDRLSASQEAARAFAALALSASSVLILIDDCVTARRLIAGGHKAQVERLRRAPDHRRMQSRLEALVKPLRRAPDYKQLLVGLEALAKDFGGKLPEGAREHFGALRLLPDDVREPFGAIRVALSYRARDLEYAVRSTSRKGDKASARSRAIGWLKESVRRLSGQDNFEHVATLCDAVLNTEDAISLDSVKRAVTPKEWLDKRF
jgi:hypothetical protein